ncbi:MULTISPECIES: LysM peptidoglycan-binding domain-containing M23 family metallopeptidase [unclassified Streptomyces]|uniref:M23 family metallopeptidase n=1 Tax=unclassified Streptomyces TaxID=2593676 RepID=UPI00224CD657|nr:MULTISPECIES: LysM peptidoglycan-binding domain-containing M23 family metallopeptidase [unclassified Streptomyces]MCX4529022.1 LysM peptidoglycan-binding domain-containing M23 family metallopeptidase [Streptomyces sp. NBC_01551]MCX4540295.1 LysM peptidoglycan-binding domain-containing M23 family metallopeptidase [Streptomyces sp. NBC_01565]
MPAKGKHRRPKSRSISRGFAVAGTGGAALALPLLGATGASAAGGQTAAPAAAPASAPQVRAAAPQVQAAAPQATQAAPAVYTVVPGDYLSKIAAERHLEGGWERLYEDNREAVGANPSLIHPGLKLTLGAKGAAAEAPAQSAPAPKRAQQPTQRSADRSAEKPAERSAPAPKAKAKTAAAAPAKQQDAGSSTATGKTAAFVAPVGGGISTQYKTAGAMWSSGYHTGVDFIASSGTTVRAVGAGTVVSAGWAGSYGNEVVIRHADGKYSQYGHLSQLSVSTGQSVTPGQTIGLSGSTGNSTGPHLHFEIRTGPSYGSDIDPLAYLRTKGVSI